MDATLAVRRQVRRIADSTRRVMFGPAYYAVGSRAEPDANDDLVELKSRMERVKEIVRDPDRTEFRVVLLPEAMAIRETRRFVDRLRAFDVPVRTLLVNGVLEDADDRCDRCRARRARHEQRLDEIRRRFPGLDVQRLPALDGEARGTESLATIADRLRI